MRKRRQYPVIWIAIFLIPTTAVYLALYFGPLVTVVATAFTDWFSYQPIKFSGLANFRELFTDDRDFVQALVNTGGWALLAVAFKVPFGILVAFVLERKLVGWRIVRTSLMMPLVISAAAWAIIYLFMFNAQFGLVNTVIRALGAEDFQLNWFFNKTTAFWTVSFTWLFYTVNITLISLAELLAIPEEISESAVIDGANEFQIMFRIKIPLIRNIVGTSFVLVIVETLRQFEHIFLTTGGGPGNRTMNLSVLLFDNLIKLRYGYANAIGVVLFVLGIAVVVGINRLLRMSKETY